MSRQDATGTSRAGRKFVSLRVDVGEDGLATLWSDPKVANGLANQSFEMLGIKLSLGGIGKAPYSEMVRIALLVRQIAETGGSVSLVWPLKNSPGEVARRAQLARMHFGELFATRSRKWTSNVEIVGWEPSATTQRGRWYESLSIPMIWIDRQAFAEFSDPWRERPAFGKDVLRELRSSIAEIGPLDATQTSVFINSVLLELAWNIVLHSGSEQAKLRKGRGGVWRIPPSFDGAKRAPLPRFTVLRPSDLRALDDFFHTWARLLIRVLVPGANVLVATNPLLSHVVAGALSRAGLEKRGELVRLVMTIRGGDRPKAAHEEFTGVSVMPRSMWEPWLV